MIFHDNYELLALRGGDEEIALPGREISSGRDVLVHLLSAGYTIENRVLLRAIDKLPPAYQQKVLDKGDHEGIPYVVTEVLPPKVKLRDWIAEAKAAAPPRQVPDSPIKSGVWKVTANPGTPAASVSPEKSPQPEAGEFTRLFQSVKEQPPVTRPISPEDTPTAAIALPNLPEETPPATVKPAPGEFTRMLRSAAAPAAPAEAEPDEFTRMLRASAPPPAPTPPPAPAKEPEPGEFTRILSGIAPQPPSSMPASATPIPRPVESKPAPPPPTPAPAPPPPAATREPGEFTRILSGIAPQPPISMPASATPIPQPVESKPAPPAATREPGEFTRILSGVAPQPPISMPTSATAIPQPVESKPAPPPPPPPAASKPVPSAAPGDFTRMMQSPLTPGSLRSQPAQPAQAASEFTRMMQAGQFAGAPPRQTPPPPPPASSARDRSLQTPGEFTRMFSTDPAPAESLAAPVEQAPLPQGGAATGAFSRRVTSSPAEPAAGPSEFTQMFGPRPAAPAPKPPEPKPAAPPSPPKAEKSYLPLVLILAALFVLVVILIVVFALTR
ncbi:MAG TPA: hypothetical protein VMT86_18810 [Bryobacteraceae bacterium]|nr:hypothetical protein [Bryobacteraceae bacterium]